ncbi:MAG TPA: hypothetical protein VGM39_09945, partial [Kofleriaceae bacterium]
EHMPADDELRAWITTGKGIPRNLLAVLVAHTKNDLYERVLASKIPDGSLFQPFLAGYFPPSAANKFKEQVAKHQLRREIIATVVTNAIINQAGTTLLVTLAKETSAPLDELVTRYFIIDELLGGQGFRASVHGADYRIPAADQYAALMAFEEIHRSLLRWWAWNESSWKLGSDDVTKLKPKFDQAADALLKGLEPAARLAYDQRMQELVKQGFSTEIASTLAKAPMLREAFAVLATSRDTKATPENAAPAFHKIGKDLFVDAFEDILATQVPANVWERRFHATLEREAASVRQKAVARLIDSPDFIDKNRERIDKIGDGLTMVRQLGGHGLIPLSLILEEYRALT